jgi:hypothetical protein
LTQDTKTEKNVPNDRKISNGHKIYQMAVKLTKWPLNIPTSSIAKPSIIYPNWDFWFENKPSGIPAVLRGLAFWLAFIELLNGSAC